MTDRTPPTPETPEARRQRLETEQVELENAKLHLEKDRLKHDLDDSKGLLHSLASNASGLTSAITMAAAAFSLWLAVTNWNNQKTEEHKQEAAKQELERKAQQQAFDQETDRLMREGLAMATYQGPEANFGRRVVGVWQLSAIWGRTDKYDSILANTLGAIPPPPRDLFRRTSRPAGAVLSLLRGTFVSRLCSSEIYQYPVRP